MYIIHVILEGTCCLLNLKYKYEVAWMLFLLSTCPVTACKTSSYLLSHLIPIFLNLLFLIC